MYFKKIEAIPKIKNLIVFCVGNGMRLAHQNGKRVLAISAENEEAFQYVFDQVKLLEEKIGFAWPRLDIGNKNNYSSFTKETLSTAIGYLLGQFFQQTFFDYEFKSWRLYREFPFDWMQIDYLLRIEPVFSEQNIVSKMIFDKQLDKEIPKMRYYRLQGIYSNVLAWRILRLGVSGWAFRFVVFPAADFVTGTLRREISGWNLAVANFEIANFEDPKIFEIFNIENILRH